MMIYCDEPKQGVIRRVRPLPRTIEGVLEAHTRLLSVPNFLDTDDEFMGLTSLLTEEVDVLEVDNVGLVALDLIERGRHARIHCTFWDKRLRGREFLCRRITEEWIDKYGLKGIYCQVAPTASVLRRFLERVGYVLGVEQPEVVQYEYLSPHYLHRVNSATVRNN